jgi:hypothetical protein
MVIGRRRFSQERRRLAPRSPNFHLNRPFLSNNLTKINPTAPLPAMLQYRQENQCTKRTVWLRSFKKPPQPGPHPRNLEFPCTKMPSAPSPQIRWSGCGALAVLHLSERIPEFHCQITPGERMVEFIAKYKDQIQGTLTGFDRLVLGGRFGRVPISTGSEGLACHGYGTLLSDKPDLVERLCGTRQVSQ